MINPCRTDPLGIAVMFLWFGFCIGGSLVGWLMKTGRLK